MGYHSHCSNILYVMKQFHSWLDKLTKEVNGFSHASGATSESSSSSSSMFWSSAAAAHASQIALPARDPANTEIV
jgi:hypothetical protein